MYRKVDPWRFPVEAVLPELLACRILHVTPGRFEKDFTVCAASAEGGACDPTRNPDRQLEITMGEFEGKVALVTGGTSGIGRETAVLFAKRGARVVVAGRRENEGNETVELIRSVGGEGMFVPTDVSRASDVKAVVEKTVKAFGGLDYAFNNAGTEGNWVPIVEQSEEDWDRTIAINLKGTWLCLKFEMQQMLKQGRGGAIVNMSSVAGFIGWHGVATYSASKHGVLGLTKSAALEVAKTGVRVNAVCPAVIETAMAERLFGLPDANKRSLGLHPIGRFGKPLEVAEAVVWMCSGAASFMTGQSLVLDGGFLAGVSAPGN
jgi:NAD(P)-dependent dehydrogenase (short-subunit alcohol dehydrogenase family)